MTVDGTAAAAAIGSVPDPWIATRRHPARCAAHPVAAGPRSDARSPRRRRGLIVTSAQDTVRTQSRSPNGHRFTDLTDRVPGNGMLAQAPGPALPDHGVIGAVSSNTAALSGWSIVAEVVQRLLDAGEQPPVYLSANIPGGDQHNRILEQRHAGRIRRAA
jgi:uncharacterized phosphosugar-binding protein